MIKQYVGNNYENLAKYCKGELIDTIMLNTKVIPRVSEVPDWDAKLLYPSYDTSKSELIILYTPVKKYGKAREFKSITTLESASYRHDRREALTDVCNSAKKIIEETEKGIKDIGLKVIRV